MAFVESMSGSRAEPNPLFAIVVLYNVHPGASPALNSLLAALDLLPAGVGHISLLLWDNTPGGQDPGTLDSRVSYHAETSNCGLAKAYNVAAEMAATGGSEWLLTLDQDTALPPEFVPTMIELIRMHAAHPEIAAIVPRVVDGSRTLSPYRLLAGGIPQWISAKSNDIAPGPVYAVNSGSVLRVAALREVGGYDPSFPLDLSDINLFHKLHRAGQCVLVAGTLTIQHQLALLDKAGRMSPMRYRAGLMDECAFYDMHINWVGRLERVVRLAGRAFRDRMSTMKPFRDITLRELQRRLITSRARRLQDWKSWVDAGRPS